MEERARQQTHRAAANALWPYLAAIHIGIMEWPQATSWTVLDPTGRGRAGGYSSAQNLGGPLPRTVNTLDEGRILTEVKPDKWPGNTQLAVRLWETTYQRLYQRLHFRTQLDLESAYAEDHHRRPFVQATNRHGTPVLRRQNHPDTRITRPIADFMEAVAAAADIEIVTPELEAALLDDDDIDAHQIRSTEVFAIAQRAGVEPKD